MELSVSHIEDPQALLHTELDCLWLWLEPRSSSRPLLGQALQSIDWELQGALSRFLKDPPQGSDQTTFIPTQGKLKTKLIAIDRGKASPVSRFLENSAGLKLNEVWMLCENQDLSLQFKRGLSKEKSASYPTRLKIISDKAVQEPA